MALTKLGWTVWKRTYAREGETKYEHTIDRCLRACQTQLNCGFTDDELSEFRELLLTQKCSFAGRFLWQLGTETVDRLGLLSLQNCAAMLLDRPVTCYAWLFDALMLGVGVGFNIETKTIRNIEQVRYCEIEHMHVQMPDDINSFYNSSDGDLYYNDCEGGEPIFVVPDSREGWVRLLTLILKQHFPKDGETNDDDLVSKFRYNTWQVRPKGAPIKRFGGVASGHETLVWGLGEINRILNAASGDQPTSVDLLDIANLIGHIVVSGNVRRCLAFDTPVWTLDATSAAVPTDPLKLRLKQIKDVVVGDSVWTHQKRWRRVTATFPQRKQPCLEIKASSGETFYMTDRHRIYVETRHGDRKWMTAGEVARAHAVVPDCYRLVCAPMNSNSTQQTVAIDSIDISSGFFGTRVCKTYDLEVDEDASFVIGETSCVVVHNSAQIAVGSPDDKPFLQAKRWDSDEVPPYWRCNSNNSVAVYQIRSLDDNFWDLYSGNSECYGLINLPLCRSAGQVGSETATPKVDPDVVCVNPCAEQPLANMETCCLAEIFLPNCDSADELRRVCYFLYRVCKHSLRLPCHWPQTEAIVHKNMRMGLGVSGYLETTEEQKQWLPEAALWLDHFDVDYSKQHGWPVSIKLRTVKPSGTLSLLGGVTAGCHPAFAKYYLKRMRMTRDWGDDAKLRGYHVEPVEYIVQDEDTGQPLTRYDDRTCVVDFPVTHRDSVVTKDDMSAIDQIKVMQRLQRDWSDNAVSMTVYYRLSELTEIRAYLEKEYRTGIKGISFLLRNDHGFRQAPWTEITQAEYERRVADIRRPFGCDTDVDGVVDISKLKVADDDELADNDECSGGSCPRR